MQPSRPVNGSGRRLREALYPKLGFREVARQIHYVMPLTGDGGAADQTDAPGADRE